VDEKNKERKEMGCRLRKDQRGVGDGKEVEKHVLKTKGRKLRRKRRRTGTKYYRHSFTFFHLFVNMEACLFLRFSVEEKG
jgi:hypothetical protein